MLVSGSLAKAPREFFSLQFRQFLGRREAFEKILSRYLTMHRARRVNVFLNIYELNSFDKYNGYLVPVGLGAYHSGVEVYGEEISFGYHDDNSTGIFNIDPRTAPDCTFVYVPLFTSLALVNVWNCPF